MTLAIAAELSGTLFAARVAAAGRLGAGAAGAFDAIVAAGGSAPLPRFLPPEGTVAAAAVATAFAAATRRGAPTPLLAPSSQPRSR